MRTARPVLFVAAATAIALTVLTGCSTTNSKAATRTGPPAVSVAVATVQRQDMPVYLTGLGTVTPLNAVSVKTRVDGQLIQVIYKEGEHVKKGDLLAVIDPRPFEVALSQAQAQLYKDQAQYRDAKLNYERFAALFKDSGAVSQQQVDTQRATMDQFEGAVRTDQAAIDNAKLNLAYCHITAPISGRIGLRLVDPGNMVHASDQNPLLIIAQLQPITTIFTLPQDQLPAVAHQMRSGPLQVDAYSQDDQTKVATGRLLTIDNEIDPTTGTGRLKAEFNNNENALWPNQFVNIHLLLRVLKNVDVVPAAAVQRGPQGTFVYTVKPDSTAEVRPVTVALTQNNLSAISQGLNPGDVVVTDGQDKLQAGSKVEARSGSPAGNTGAAGAQGSPAAGQADASSPNPAPGNRFPSQTIPGPNNPRNRQAPTPKSRNP